MRAGPFARAAVLVAMVAAGGLVTAVSPAIAGDTCPSSDPFVVSTSGTVSSGNPDWWRFTSSTGGVITLVPAGGDPDLKIMNSSCTGTVCYPFQGGTEKCIVPAGTFQVGVLHFSGPGGVAGYSLSFNNAACGDGQDNDGDGNVDYPDDPGCSEPNDTTEGAPCQTQITGGLRTCAGVEPGPIVVRQDVALVDVEEGPQHHVAGYVHAYRFRLPDGSTVTLPCVVLNVDATASNACSSAGGEFAFTMQTLVDSTATEPKVVPGDVIAYVGICEAELEATVNGVGVNSVRTLAPCAATVEGSPTRP